MMRWTAAKASPSILTNPSEIFAGVIGLTGPIPVFLRLDESVAVWSNFPKYLPWVWAFLMIFGGLRVLCGIRKNRGGQIMSGALMVAWQSLAYGAAVMYQTRGQGGLIVTIGAATMVILSTLRKNHLLVLREILERDER